MGRVSGSPGDVCRIQYFGEVPRESATFEILVQEAP